MNSGYSNNNDGRTIVEKIVSRACGRKDSQGEVVAPPAISNFQDDFNRVFEEAFGNIEQGLVQKKKNQKRVFDPSRVRFIPDHTVPSCSVMVSKGISLMKDFAKEHGIMMYKEGDGIEHTLVTEEGFVRPGEVVVATDSHTDTVGAIGALGFGIGTTEAEYALALGEIYDFFVPETYRFEVSGEFPSGVFAKDLILHILGTLKEGGCSKRIAEYGGETIRKMGMDGRFTICNMSVEMSARSAIVNPDQVTMDFIADIVSRHPELSVELAESMNSVKFTESDANAEYSSRMDVDASKL